MAQKFAHVVILPLLLASLLATLPASRANGQGLPLRSQQYLGDAQHLAAVLGKAHGVRYACKGKHDQYWRKHMIELLDLEAPDRGALRDSLVRAFNNAFKRTRSRFPLCTTETVEAEATYAAEGREIADRMAAYYFPKPGRN
ncbi:MAG: TIGR02301 family protein [Alphaproteobacteria bacterium]|jgi:uncharacterized protein (TIGR02301 family)|nr:TIGR02301 family protein [Alphaproteobacteria bacterium]